MIRKSLLFVFSLILIGSVNAQEISVEGEKEIVPLGTAEACHAVFSPDGNQLLFTGSDYATLQLIDLNTSETQNISNDRGAGYQPVFSPDGEEIYFRSDNYEGMKRYTAVKGYSLVKKEMRTLQAGARRVNSPVINNNQIMLQVSGRETRIAASNRTKSLTPEYSVAGRNQQLALTGKTETKYLAPLGKGNYIWASVSPNQKNILFTFAGKGTFVCDLTGKILAQLGNLNAPSWLNDQWVVGMDDKDDGTRIISSDIIACNLEAKKIMLTNTTDRIEMYPACSPKGDKIAFNTPEGKLFILEIKNQE